MRGDMGQGRFSIEFEHQSINTGMIEDLREPVGSVVDWWVFDQAHLDTDPTDAISSIYDTSSPTPGGGLLWIPPIEMPVIMAQLVRGDSVVNERGFYVVDSFRLVLAAADVVRLLPDLLVNPSVHIKDRIVWQNDVFTPTRVNPKGRFSTNYAVVTVDLTEVNAEELQNSSQFLDYAN